MQTRVRFDVAVVGGGIAGISVAAELGGDDIRVVVVEQEERLAHHASGRSAAAFLESYGSPEIRALTRASRPYLSMVEADEAPLLNPRPLVWVAGVGHESTVERLVATEPLLRAISPEEARALCPALRPEWLAAAAAEDGAQDLDVAGLFDRYRRRALRSGVAILTGARLRSGSRDGDGWRLETDAGTILAATVVDAAGAWADNVASVLGVPAIGFRPLRRTVAIVTTPAVRRDWPLVADVAEGFYFRPEGDALLISPADETASEPSDARASTEDVALALDRVNEATTLDLRHVRMSWAGLRTFSPDRNPVVGVDPAYAGFVWLAGQGGYGMQTAPAMARLAAVLVHGQPVPDELGAAGLDVGRLTPQRFSPG
jgi:D-arginine dehydrogenase